MLADVGGGSWHPERDARPWVRFTLTAHLRQARTMLRRVNESEQLWVALDKLTQERRLPERAINALSMLPRTASPQCNVPSHEQRRDQRCCSWSRTPRHLLSAGYWNPTVSDVDGTTPGPQNSGRCGQRSGVGGRGGMMPPVRARQPTGAVARAAVQRLSAPTSLRRFFGDLPALFRRQLLCPRLPTLDRLRVLLGRSLGIVGFPGGDVEHPLGELVRSVGAWLSCVHGRWFGQSVNPEPESN